MADTKISALTAATTPLAGTEVAPIVQSGVTVKAAVTSFTNGLALTPTSVTLATGNLVLNGGLTSNVALIKNTGRGFGVAADRWIGSDGTFTTWFYNVPTGGGHYFAVNQVNKLTVVGDNVTLPDGNLVIGTSGKGIDFSATPGTGTSELLADYEEGTYTPTWNGGTITTVVSAYYTKIGRQVTVIADLILGTSASVADSEITVPFTALSASNWGSGGVAYTTYGATLFVSFDATTSKINFRATANTAVLTGAAVASSRFAFTLTYFV